jgi:hypothetical protein
MDIVLDANIIRRDLKLKDKNFEILTDYLNKTASNLILPQIAFEESIGLYKRLLLEKIDELKRATEKLQSTLTTQKIAPVSNIDIEREVKDYEAFLKQQLRLKDKQIVKYKNEYLPELVNRAIDRQKPLDGSGQQFRDGLLWLTILDHAESLEEKRLIFISDNSADFSEKSQNELNVQLKSEADSRKLTIVYYKTISDFVKEHASRVDFITDEWIKENVAFDKLEEIFNKEIESAESNVLDHAKDNLDRNEEVTGYVNASSYINSNLIESYVYEMSDATILLNVEVQFEKEYEIEVEREVEKDMSDYEYESNYNPHTGEIEWERYFVPRVQPRREHDYKYEYPLFRGKFVITIRDKVITDYEFKEWDWG